MESCHYQFLTEMIFLFTISDLNKSNVTTTKYQVWLVWDRQPQFANFLQPSQKTNE